MSKTHTKINQLAGETLKGFAYANNTDKELVDDVLATRDIDTNYTELARNYDSQGQQITFNGTGLNDFQLSGISTKRPYTFTIDSALNFLGYEGTLPSSAYTISGTYSSSNIATTYNISISGDYYVDITGYTGGTITPATNSTIYSSGGGTGRFISEGSGTIRVGSITSSPLSLNVGDVITDVYGNPLFTVDAGMTIGSPVTNDIFDFRYTTVTVSGGSYYDSPTSSYVITGTAQALFGGFDITFTSTTGNTQLQEVSFGYVYGAYRNFFSGYTGSINNGDTFTQATSGATGVVSYIDFSGAVYLTQISGVIDYTEDLLLPSGTVTLGVQSAADKAYCDTFTWTDGTTTENQVVITNGNQVLDSGNITINFSNKTGHTIGESWDLTFPTVTVTTGYESNQVQFPNFPFALDASALVGTDGTDKVAIGVFDFSPFGQDKLTAGIVSFYGDGSQSTFTEGKGSANLALFDVATNKSLEVNYSGDEFRVSGYDGSGQFAQAINRNNFRYTTNGTTQYLPTSYGNNGDVIKTDGAGDWYWSSPANAGNISTVSFNYSFLPTDITVHVDTTSGPVTIVLPNPFSSVVDYNYNVKIINGTNNVTIIPFSIETIDGTSSFVMSNPLGKQSASFYTDGANWFVR